MFRLLSTQIRSKDREPVIFLNEHGCSRCCLHHLFSEQETHSDWLQFDTWNQSKTVASRSVELYPYLQKFVDDKVNVVVTNEVKLKKR